MASTIKLKRGSGVPSGGSLAAGEPALDLTNNKLYSSTDGTDVVEISATTPFNGQFADGSVALDGTSGLYEGVPSITFTNDTDTGFFRNGSGKIGFLSGGIWRGFELTNSDIFLTKGIFADGTEYLKCELLPRLSMNITGPVTNYKYLTFRVSNSEVGSIAVGTTATAYNTSSDYRLKENVVPIENAVARIDSLNPVRFNFKVEPSVTVDGFIAHEVTPVVPEAISGEKDAVDENGNPVYQGIDQAKLVPLLVAAVQELSARVAELEAR